MGDKQLTAQELQSAAKQLDVKTPIMSHKVVGNRVELHLLGGAVVQGQVKDLGAAETPDLDSLGYRELYELAKTHNIKHRSNMNAEELREALKEIYDG